MWHPILVPSLREKSLVGEEKIETSAPSPSSSIKLDAFFFLPKKVIRLHFHLKLEM